MVSLVSPSFLMKYWKVNVLVICGYVTNDPLKQFKTSDIYYLRVTVGQVSQLGTSDLWSLGRL